ncbi:MAG: VOC family protein [Gemmatimonadetes bacterium]|nr:VOC family protein [Gemmatimonadota bacterium]
MSEIPLGRFVWYELLTDDPDGAQPFYKEVVGWGTSEWGDGPEPYTMWMNGETPVGGVMQLPEEAKAMGAPPHWLAYVATPDVDETGMRATALGGTILNGPMDIPMVGRISIIADPQGAVFAAFMPVDEVPGHEGPANLGEFSWHELITSDWEGAFAFYSALFGWEKTEAMDMGEMGTYQMFGRNGQTLGGMFNKSPDMPQPPSWLYYARVPDVDAAAEKVTSLGGTILNGPMEVPGGDKIVQCMDLHGVAFALHAKAPA